MTLRKALLACGVVSSLLYVAIDVLAAARYGAYHSFSSQAVSELMARGAPTKALVDPLFMLYDVLALAFGAGVWMSAPGNRPLRITAGCLIAYGVLGLPGPWLFPMNLRGSGDVAGDVPHIVLTGVLVLLLIGALVSAAFALGRPFRLYSFATLAASLPIGVLTSLQARGVATGGPTPSLGLLERAEIGAFLLWIAVLALALLRAAERPAARAPRRERELGLGGVS